MINPKTNKVEKKGTVDDIQQTITITTDGEWIISIQVIDEAGNKSDSESINIYKDTGVPNIYSVNVREETGTGFTVVVGAEDGISGIAKYEVLLDNNVKGTSTSNAVKATGFQPSRTYDNIVVRVWDNAGNNKDITTSATTKEELKAPQVTIDGTKGPGTDGNYYRGTVNVRITDNGGTNTSTTKIRYTIDNSNYTEVDRGNGTITVPIPNDGTYTVKAYAKDAAGNQSGESNTITFKRDTGNPTPSLSLSATANSITATVSGSDNNGGSRSI